MMVCTTQTLDIDTTTAMWISAGFNFGLWCVVFNLAIVDLIGED
jgi:hypothetical protein